MRTFVLLCWLVSARTTTAANSNECKDGIQFDGVYYATETLDYFDRPSQLVVNRKTDTLFFRYKESTSVEKSSSTAYVNLTSKYSDTIPGLKNGYATAIDNANGTVYLGGFDGIFKFDEASKTAVPVVKDKNIWNMFFQEHLYYIDYPGKHLYQYGGGEPTIVPEFANRKINQFAIDKSSERFFENDIGLYGLERGVDIENAKLYSTRAFSGINVDKNGKTYFSGEIGIHTLDKENKLKLVARIDDANGLAFDRNNRLIYATQSKIVRLTEVLSESDVC